MRRSIAIAALRGMLVLTLFNAVPVAEAVGAPSPGVVEVTVVVTPYATCRRATDPVAGRGQESVRNQGMRPRWCAKVNNPLINGA